MHRPLCLAITAAVMTMLATLGGCGNDDTPLPPLTVPSGLAPVDTLRQPPATQATTAPASQPAQHPVPATAPSPAASQPAAGGTTQPAGTQPAPGMATTQPIDWDHFRDADVKQANKWLDEFWVQFNAHHFNEAKATFAKIQKLKAERPLSDVVRFNIEKAGNAILGLQATEDLGAKDEPAK